MKSKRTRIICFVLLLCLISACSDNQPQSIRRQLYKQTAVPVYRYELLKSYPLRDKPFIEGLVYQNDQLYLSSGLYGHSVLQIRDLLSGDIKKEVNLGADYFAEGITILKKKLYQLTYRSGKGFIYDPMSLKKIGAFYHHGEGWGLTNNGENLILSNGSADLLFIEPNEFKVIRRITARSQLNMTLSLNELEFHQGYIYANIWQTSLMVIIDARAGLVTGVIDLEGLQTHRNQNCVTNGVTFIGDRMLVGGKCWDQLYEIKLIKAN